MIGAGLGGLRTVEQLRSAGFKGSISLVGAEPHAPYDRPPLSKQVLTGAWTPERVMLRDADALAALRVSTRFGVPAVALREDAVEFADGTALTADAFVIATGAEARTVPGQPKEVHTLRTLDDSLSLRSALHGANSLLVVGGGFIGAEVASGAVDQGLRVTVLEALPVPCERALGPEAGVLCGRLITEGGADLRLGAKLTRFVSANTVELADGERLTADVVLVGIGAAPALDWLAGSGVVVTNGIACDTSGRVLGLPGVWAIGDVAAWKDPLRGGHFRYEHWTSATDQAAVVARDIVGTEPPPRTVPYFWSDQFGLKIQGIGRPDLADSVLPLKGEGLAGGAIKGTVTGYFARERLVGVVGFGAAQWVARYRALVAQNAGRAEVLALE
ncbi:NAD/ferredoxin-dependent reductase-like protein [Saccharopolyspora spinosa]|uniref:NAD/ferredoxin-dependent reductase-like protein n=1 Tax=Saccharopolyspora spinosa TaxID=60894 RepID=A0A2N3Y1I6_SACSN|nr:NAD/ferredoxin-dependent reductase-like protein [Saccharopolyspora spinosa]